LKAEGFRSLREVRDTLFGFFPEKKGGRFFFHALSLLKGPRGKQEEDFFLFLIPCLVLCPSAIIILLANGGERTGGNPQEESFYCLLRWHFSFFRYEALTHFGAPQTNTTIQSEKVEYDVDATEGEKTKAINVTGPDGSNVLGSKRLYRKHKGGGSGGPDGEEAPGEPEAH
jgi:hypothetical protein